MANPWAVCSKSVGAKKSAKRERCIQKVKQQNLASGIPARGKARKKKR